MLLVGLVRRGVVHPRSGDDDAPAGTAGSPVGRVGLGLGVWVGDGEELGDVLGEVVGDVLGEVVGLTDVVGLGDGDVVASGLAVRLACAAAVPIDGMSTTLRDTAAAPASAHIRRREFTPPRRDRMVLLVAAADPGLRMRIMGGHPPA